MCTWIAHVDFLFLIKLFANLARHGKGQGVCPSNKNWRGLGVGLEWAWRGTSPVLTESNLSPPAKVAVFLQAYRSFGVSVI